MKGAEFPHYFMSTNTSVRSTFFRGMRDGIPIGLGYFAVSFSLGIVARNIGLNAIQGFFLSFLNLASAGEYAGLSAMKDNSSYVELAILILIANARYILMSCALSQKLSPDMPVRHRLLLGYGVTDEIFGLEISFPDYLRPEYTYGAYVTTVLPWSIGTSLGIVIGNILPAVAVVSLSGAIYGMFISIVIPPTRKNKKTAVIVFASFVLSTVCAFAPILSKMSEGIRIIVLTVVISVIAALIFPVDDKEGEQ